MPVWWIQRRSRVPTIRRNYQCRQINALWIHPEGVITLQWRHNERDGVLNTWRLDCLLKRLFRRRSKKTSKLRVAGLFDGNQPVTGWFPSQRASNAESVCIWWRHHGCEETNPPVTNKPTGLHCTVTRIYYVCNRTSNYIYNPTAIRQEFKDKALS